MSHLASIYAIWDGNAEAMAADIGESGVTVRQWRNRGNIPPRYWEKIILAAAKRGELIDWRSFVPHDDSEAGEATRPFPAKTIAEQAGIAA